MVTANYESELISEIKILKKLNYYKVKTEPHASDTLPPFSLLT